MVDEHPLPWLAPLLNGVEHANFFETRATEYSKAATRGDWNNVLGQLRPEDEGEGRATDGEARAPRSADGGRAGHVRGGRGGGGVDLFTRPTVVVVGAGASFELGTSGWRRSQERIADLLNITFPDGYNQKSGDYQIKELVRARPTIVGNVTGIPSFTNAGC